MCFHVSADVMQTLATKKDILELTLGKNFPDVAQTFLSVQTSSRFAAKRHRQECLCYGKNISTQFPSSPLQSFISRAFCSTMLVWLLACFCNNSTFAQGFNWQYSSRFPTSSPTLFVGVHGGFAPYSLNTLQLPYKEIQTNGDTCLCAEFSGAQGQEWRIGLVAEQWLEDGAFALFGAITLHNQRETFSAQSRALPVNPNIFPNTPDLITEYLFTNNLFQTSLELGAKYKFYPLPIFASLGISSAYVVQAQNRLVEQISTSSRGAYNFPEQVLSPTFFAINPLSFAATVRLGADVSLAKGLYASPALFATWQIRDIQTNTAWTRLTLGLHVSILLGL